MSNKHYLTDDIIKLIQQAILDVRGSKAAFCRMTGITPYNLSKLLSGKKKYVFGDDWNRLCDFFPEIDDREKSEKSIPAKGENNIEDFRSGLISKIIMLQIDPAAKDIVLQTIQSYKGE